MRTNEADDNKADDKEDEQKAKLIRWMETGRSSSKSLRTFHLDHLSLMFLLRCSNGLDVRMAIIEPRHQARWSGRGQYLRPNSPFRMRLHRIQSIQPIAQAPDQLCHLNNRLLLYFYPTYFELSLRHKPLLIG